MNVTTTTTGIRFTWEQVDADLVRCHIPGHGTLTLPLNIAARLSDWLSMPVDAAPGMLALDDVHRLVDSIGRVILWRNFDGVVYASVVRTQRDKRRFPPLSAAQLTVNLNAVDVDPFGLLMVTQSMLNAGRAMRRPARLPPDGPPPRPESRTRRPVRSPSY